MDSNINRRNKVFTSGSIFDESCDLFSFRIDFYSKPNFYNAFMDLWDEMLSDF